MTIIEHEPDDAELITRYRGGDDSAATVLYQRHYERARRLAVSIAGSSHAEDVASEAFIGVLAVIRKGQGPEVAFRAYLLASVRNAYVSMVRRDHRYLWVDDYSEVETDVAARDETLLRSESSLLAVAFQSLPERWQTVLWHTTIEHDPYDEVGRLLGIAPSAVAALAYRAREGLRQAYLSAHLASTPEPACRSTHERLPAFSRDQLPARSRREVQTHLDDCATCSAAISDLRGMTSSLGAVLAPAVLGAAAGAGYLGTTPDDARARKPRKVRRTIAAGVAVAASAAIIAVAVFAAQEDDPPGSWHADPSPATTPEASSAPPPDQASTAPTTATGELPLLQDPRVTPTGAPLPATSADPPRDAGGPDDGGSLDDPARTRPVPSPTHRPTRPEAARPMAVTRTTYDLVVKRTSVEHEPTPDGRSTTFVLQVDSPAPESTLTMTLTGVTGWAPDARWPDSCRVSQTDTKVTALCPLSAPLHTDLGFTTDWSGTVKMVASLSAPNNQDPSDPPDHTTSYQAWS